MEPVIGTLSFVLLAAQFVRSITFSNPSKSFDSLTFVSRRTQMLNMKLKPFGHMMLQWRGNRLVKLYPQYNASIVRDFARSDPWSDSQKLTAKK